MERYLNSAKIIPFTNGKGFPDTVDKLEPEVGQLLGPKPILFG